jgi:UDP-glucose 4-epimerase
MRIVVTGGAGFIGRHVVGRLREAGHDVIVADLRGQGAEPVDILRFEQLRRVVADAEVVYHLAGPVLETARRDPFHASTLQFDGTLNVLEASRAEGGRRVVIASSFYVYDGIAADEIVNESSPISSNGMELFGALKVMAEQLTLAYHRKFGLSYVILRFGSAFGLGQGSNLIQTFFETGQKGEVLEVWGAGRRRNQYTYVNDLANGCLAALGTENEIVNLISPEETSTGELATIMENRFGYKSRFREDKPEGASVPYMSARKAIRTLGWEPTPLVDALDQIKTELSTRELSGSSIP